LASELPPAARADHEAQSRAVGSRREVRRAPGRAPRASGRAPVRICEFRGTPPRPFVLGIPGGSLIMAKKLIAFVALGVCGLLLLSARAEAQVRVGVHVGFGRPAVYRAPFRYNRYPYAAYAAPVVVAPVVGAAPFIPYYVYEPYVYPAYRPYPVYRRYYPPI